MKILIAPVDCRLSRPSLETVSVYVGVGLGALEPRIRVQKAARFIGAKNSPIEAEVYFEYVQRFDPLAVALVSSNIREENYDIWGQAWETEGLALARTYPSLSGRLKLRGIAQTIIHEIGHLAGIGHHRVKQYSIDDLLCPLMKDSDPRLTSIYPCTRCNARLCAFRERYSRSHAA
ncbi:hypothetical protein GF342_03020 [Candidatus Woesearchaeota archaeon]|nr:hypothetical protein [Candidatus Woesearchaeota archaeon]